MSKLEIMLAFLDEIDSEASAYIRQVLDNPDEYKRVSMWKKSRSLQALEESFELKPTVGYLFVFANTPQGSSYWDRIDGELRERWDKWFN